MNKKNDNFIDLFAGIGGFHLAAKRNGLNFVFGSEIDNTPRAIYEKNHKVKIAGDITAIDEKEIPSADWIFGGFPCQSFSRSGKKLGFEDTRGTLFFEVARIVKEKMPRFVILENVKGLISHDDGRTFEVINRTIGDMGYITTENPLVLSPSDIGKPQRRMRVFLVFVRKDLTDDKYVNLQIKRKKPKSFFDECKRDVNHKNLIEISEYHKKVILLWKDFRERTKNIQYSFSIWADYFQYKGNFKGMPEWKVNIIKKNIEFYNENKKIIDEWIKDHDLFKRYFPTHWKFEWSCGYEDGVEFDNKLIQMRPSGLRIIRSNSFPTLTTITNQNPIIFPEMRRISTEEFKKLQGFPKTFICDEYNNAAKQFGNAVNVDVVSTIIKEIRRLYDK